MYSQFERQYSDFLRSHLTQLDIPNNRSTEEDLLEHVRTHLNSCSQPSSSSPDRSSSSPSISSFGPKLTKSCKSDDLARAHISFAKELLERNGLVLAMSELGEAVKNSCSMETLVMGLAVRVVVLERLELCWEMKSDLNLLRSVCCRDCHRAIFSKSKQKGSSIERDSNQYQTFINKFGQIEKCPLTKHERSQLREIISKHSKSASSGNILPDHQTGSPHPHNPPRLCSVPELASEAVLSEEYGFVSSKVRIEQSEERGRFVRANEDIQIGKNLGSENSAFRI